MAAKHTPPGDDSFRASLLRNLGGGAALIVLVAAVFFGVGQFGGDDGAPEVAGSSRDAEDEEAGEQVPDEEDPASEPEEEPDDVEEPPEPEPEPEPTEPEDDAGEVDDGDDAETDDEEGSEAEEETEAPPGLVPGDISVQVLDGVGTDGGAASRRVATELDDLGYRVVARNPALAYEETTVLWTRGNEDRARKVAADLGVSAIREQPGNLSEQVDVHVVVGADRA